MTRPTAAVLVGALVLSACSATSVESVPDASVGGSATSAAPAPPASALDRDRVDDVLGRCPDPADVAFVAAAVSIDTGRIPAPGDCPGAVDGERIDPATRSLVHALLILEAAAFEEPLPWTDLELFVWLTSTIDGIAVRPAVESSFCCDPAGVVVLGADAVPDLTDRWIDPDTGIGLVGVIGTLAHLARHAEGWEHGCPPDDQALAALGPWGVESLVYRWFADHGDRGFFDDPQRPGALIEAVRERADRIVDQHMCSTG